MSDVVAGREMPRVYRTSKRGDLQEFLLRAIEAAGGRVLYVSNENRAPIYIGIQTTRNERIGVLVYPFRATCNEIKNRPQDEHRIQIRYGKEETWKETHRVARDMAAVDTTLILGIHLQANLFIGLDPLLYDPLPMGISIEFKERDVAIAREQGWHVLERDNIAGRRRPNPRAPHGLETLVMFKPNRLLDYIRFEREAQDLRLDAPLRFTAALNRPNSTDLIGAVHHLEQQFAMSSRQILDMISDRNRLSVAVRGGVAEFHLEQALRNDPTVIDIESLDEDGQPDFRIELSDKRKLLIECKNCSPKRYQDHSIKVEVQKTRATQGDKAGRYYRLDQFDVLAACLFAPEGHWGFAYRAVGDLRTHKDYPDRLQPIQRIDHSWARTLAEAVRA